MSTLKTSNIQNLAGTKTVPVDTVIDGSAKAWVNFNGTGTVAIRASFNVSSITDNGTGDYTINFTNPFPDANYAMTGSSGGANSTSNGAIYCYDQATARTTSLIRVLLITPAGSNTDPPAINAAFFR